MIFCIKIKIYITSHFTLQQLTFPFAADPCGFCCESSAVIAWQTTDVCFCCRSLRLLSCGDRLTNNLSLLLLRILVASVASLLCWSPDKQLTFAFAADPCGFCCESFTVITLGQIDDCFCFGSLRLLTDFFGGDLLFRQRNVILAKVSYICLFRRFIWK